MMDGLYDVRRTSTFPVFQFLVVCNLIDAAFVTLSEAEASVGLCYNR